jgi:hypothetical protein
MTYQSGKCFENNYDKNIALLFVDYQVIITRLEKNTKRNI